MQKVAITIWRQRLSPVFESSNQLMVVDCHQGRIIKQSKYSFAAYSQLAKVEALNKLKVDLLICGAISSTYYNVLTASGIKVISFISGAWEEILNACLQKKSSLNGYKMPGCANKHRRRFRGGR